MSNRDSRINPADKLPGERPLDVVEQDVMTRALRRGVRTVAQAATPTCEHSDRMGVCAVWCPDCGSVLRYAPEGWVPPRERCESIDGELAVGDTCTSTDSRRCDALEARLDKAEARAERLAGVLRFYADRENWLDGIQPGRSRAFHDGGEYARTALANTEDDE
jgi:hypothetical protein